MKPPTERAPRISEKQIQEAVVAFLEIDGWRAFRTELTVQRERGRVVGERGQPDYLFVRYQCEGNGRLYYADEPSRVLAEVAWIEFKRPGQKPRPDQIAWHEAEAARGAYVLVVDDFDKFRADYMKSGLARRVRPQKQVSA